MNVAVIFRQLFFFALFFRLSGQQREAPSNIAVIASAVPALQPSHRRVVSTQPHTIVPSKTCYTMHHCISALCSVLVLHAQYLCTYAAPEQLLPMCYRLVMVPGKQGLHLVRMYQRPCDPGAAQLRCSLLACCSQTLQIPTYPPAAASVGLPGPACHGQDTGADGSQHLSLPTPSTTGRARTHLEHT